MFQGIKPDREELEKICKIADSSGKVWIGYLHLPLSVTLLFDIWSVLFSDYKGGFREVFKRFRDI